MAGPITEHGLPICGTTAQRPTNAETGCRYFDTTLNMLLTWDGTQWIGVGFETISLPVDSATVIAIGDLVYLDTDDAKPASLLADAGTEGANQDAFHDLFAGRAMQASASGETSPIIIATRGRFIYACPSATFEVGTLIGASENGAGNALLNQQVEGVATANLAIGRCSKRVAPAATSVELEIVSTILYGGVQTVA